ncbi:hypothetical protein C8J56DRAFT_1022329 [Mycena floridula]|nr:hypothetical protein C8J56DRAFT_1022329 [Mycena floridula]
MSPPQDAPPEEVKVALVAVSKWKMRANFLSPLQIVQFILILSEAAKAFGDIVRENKHAVDSLNTDTNDNKDLLHHGFHLIPKITQVLESAKEGLHTLRKNKQDKTNNPQPDQSFPVIDKYIKWLQHHIQQLQSIFEGKEKDKSDLWNQWKGYQGLNKMKRTLKALQDLTEMASLIGFPLVPSS